MWPIALYLCTLSLWLSFANHAFADNLLVISPHRKSIQTEFIPKFEDYYKKTFKTDVQVKWLDQGGTSSAVRYLRTKFANNPKSAGIDVFWGGLNTFVLILQIHHPSGFIF